MTGGADFFDPNANDGIEGLAVQADGKVLVGGFFTSIGGQTRNRIARLDAVTGAADSFNPNSNDQVHAIAVKPDGKIMVAGWFSNIGGQMHLYITRLVAATGGSDGFNPNSNGLVYSMALQADDKVLVGGSFNGVFSNPSIGGQLRNRIARLLASGLADSFDPNANNPPINTAVTGVAMQADSKILVGGGFNGANSIGGQTRNYFARLTNDTPALQNLAVTQSAVTWTLGGSSPQFARVSFEYSTDNVSYTPLGEGTGAGSNWTLTGLNLPAGQNIYIRARGYYHGGYFNGSESITESVRNAFITPPTPTQVVSRKMHGDAGIFDINLPLTGDAGIECRSGGASNDYQIVFSFPSAVTFTNASVTAGTGSVSGSSGSGTSTVIVNLTGVTNAQRLTVTLLGTNDGTSTTDLSVQMGVLLGDTSGNGTVNASDVSQTKSKSGQPVDATNFRTDITVNGSINASDVSLVKSNSGTALP